MKKRIIAILAIGLIACLTLVGLVSCKDTRSGYPDGDKYSVGNGEYAASSVRSINIAWTAGSATITASNEYTSISISEKNSMSGDDWALHRYLDPDGTLWIKPVSANVEDDEIPSSGSWTTKTLEITMPQISLESFYVENHGAEIHVSGINAVSFETSNTGYGTGVSNTSVSGELKMYTTGLTGNISYEGAASGPVSISTPYGTASFISKTIPQSLEVHGHGSVFAAIPSTAEFTITFTAGTKFTYGASFDLVDAPNPVGYDNQYLTKKCGSGAIPIKLICSTKTVFKSTTNNTEITGYHVDA